MFLELIIHETLINEAKDPGFAGSDWGRTVGLVLGSNKDVGQTGLPLTVDRQEYRCDTMVYATGWMCLLVFWIHCFESPTPAVKVDQFNRLRAVTEDTFERRSWKWSWERTPVMSSGTSSELVLLRTTF